MKNIILKQYFKITIIFLFISALSFSGCSSDEGGGEGGGSTFLEINNGTKWKYTEEHPSEPGVILKTNYAKFQNDLNDPFASWYSYSTPTNERYCFDYADSSDVLFLEILKNLDNKLTVRITVSSVFSYITTITRSGDRIKVVVDANDDGKKEIITSYYDKTSDNLSNLKLCN